MNKNIPVHCECEIHEEYGKLSLWEIFTGQHYADKVIWYGLFITLLVCAFVIFR